MKTEGDVLEHRAVVGQALRLPKPKMATDAVALQFQLAFVLSALEMAF
jgi:hypothetical protein